MTDLLAVLAAYLMGSIPFAQLLSKRRGIDLREVGSAEGQAAFVEHDALMCGFCTPGFVTTISAYLKKNPNPSLAEVKEACKGNFCRCGTYPRVFEAALAAAKG